MRHLEIQTHIGTPIELEDLALQPVIDKTKLGIALLSAVGSMFLAINRFKK